MIPELLIIAAIIGLFLWREHARDRVIAKERVVWAQERSSLLNRIKPETAQIAPGEPVTSPPAVDMFDHQDYWEAKEEEQQALARIDQLQRQNGLT